MSRVEEILDILQETNPLAVILDGYNEALIGVGEGYNTDTVAIYDKDKLILLLQSKNNWSYEEAVYWYFINILGSYHSEYNPIFMTLIHEDCHRTTTDTTNDDNADSARTPHIGGDTTHDKEAERETNTSSKREEDKTIKDCFVDFC